MTCSSIIRWDEHNSGKEVGIFERLSLYDCGTKKTWSAWANEQQHLVQGYVFEHQGGQNEFIVSKNDAEHQDFCYKCIIGPSVSLFLATLVFIWLFRRRNFKRLHGDNSIALAENPHIPTSARIAVPILIFLTMALFSYANATTGATVKFSLQLFDKQVFGYSLFDFSLVNTVKDMWEAGVYPLSALVAIWSGFWPYLKCMLMLTCWFVPPNRLKPSHRRRLLISIDMLGKWALLDLFLMNMMSIAFRFHITTATIRFIPKSLATVDVLVAPEGGLFFFTTAVAFSLVANHVIVYYHRNVVSVDDVDDGRRGSSFRPLSSSTSSARVSLLEADDRVAEEKPNFCIQFPRGNWFDVGTTEAYESRKHAAIVMSTQQVSVFTHEFSSGTIPRSLLSQTGRFRVELQAGLLLFSVLTFCLIIACAVEDTFEFVFSGLAGDLIRLVDPPQAVRRSSLLSIAKDLGEDKEEGHAFGVFYLQSLYLLFSFLFPLIVLAMSVVMLVFKFGLRQAKMFFYAFEVVSAWAALDVFIVSIIAAVLQINQFSHFLEGPACDPIKKYLHVTECFGVETQLLKGCWLIVAAASCLWCFVQFVQRISERMIADREEEILQFLNAN